MDLMGVWVKERMIESERIGRTFNIWKYTPYKHEAVYPGG